MSIASVIIIGIVTIFLGIQFLFKTESFLNKMIEFQKINENSMQYKSIRTNLIMLPIKL